MLTAVVVTKNQTTMYVRTVAHPHGKKTVTFTAKY